MTSYSQAFASEIARVARKSLKPELERLRKQVAAQRGINTELKRQLVDLQRLLRQALRASKAGRPGEEASETRAERRRQFNGETFKSKRLRLELSAKDAGLLVGATALTIYNWEKGSQPRERNIPAIDEFMRMGKRVAAKRLEALR